MALQFLNAALQPRFTFTLEGPSRVDGVAAWKVAYRE
jgi:hypothetical protein